MASQPEEDPIRLLLTPGEPAGIGPDLVIELVHREREHGFVVVADPDLLRSRAKLLNKEVRIEEFDGSFPLHKPGTLVTLPVRLNAACHPGEPDPRNAEYVISTLQEALRLCMKGEAAAMVTGPVHKATINDAGIAFTGHTEWLAEVTCTKKVVMLLASSNLKVALATTHLPLREVPDRISKELLVQVLTILHRDLGRWFGIDDPHILVCGLNPHAGEGGHLGDEEINHIAPAINFLRSRGFSLTGPVPADTAFTPDMLRGTDAILAMYHDQGLPVLKHQGFGSAVNITLGLPIIRTSVDHGTALTLAGTGSADASSLITAIDYACKMSAVKIGQSR